MVNSRGFSEDFNGIFMGNPKRFFMACHLGKSMQKKNIKKAIKNQLIFQFSRAMKTLKFWANPWNTSENTMKILGCFSWPFNGVVHGLFMRPLNSWLIKNPWLFHYYWKINRSWKMFMVFWWLFEDPWKLIIQWPSNIFMA